MKLFSASAARRQGEDATLLLTLVRVGAWGSAEQFEKMTRALSD